MSCYQKRQAAGIAASRLSPAFLPFAPAGDRHRMSQTGALSKGLAIGTEFRRMIDANYEALLPASESDKFT